jgi:hypothetical protein
VLAEVGEVHDAPQDRGRAGDAPVRVKAPVDLAGAGVQRVEGAAVGAQVDRRAEPGGVGDGGGGVHVVAGLHGPVELAGGGVVGVDAPVGVAQEHAPVDDGGGRVEGAAAEQRAFGGADPDAPAGARGDGLQVARVVAEVQDAAGERRAGLDRAARPVGPGDGPGAVVERVHEPALGAQEHAPFGEQRRGLAGRGQRAPPAYLPVGAVQRDRAARIVVVAAGEDRHVDGVGGDGGGGGGELPEAPAPQHPAGALVERAQHGVVAELEDAFAVDHRRELEQRVVVVDPQGSERRAHVSGGGEEAGVVAVVAVDRPGEAVGRGLRQLRRRLGDEAGVGVVDVAGAVALV